jgi:phosphoribosyl 1,2-cyclic phosphodiesterase
MKVCLLASGSKGNALFIEAGDTRLLVDAGLSARELQSRLAAIGVDPSSLHAIVISHEHNDHIRGAGTLSRRFHIPLLTSHVAASQLRTLIGKTEQIDFSAGDGFAFRDLHIEPFPISHDAADPVGFVIESSEGRVGVATDLGIVTRLVQARLSGCRVLVLESNHDEQMLLNGPYPWHLKQRIKSRQGHLSNGDSAQLLEDLLHDGLDGVLLAHLSETNNDPALAHGLAAGVLAGQNLCSPALLMGSQRQVSTVLSL